MILMMPETATTVGVSTTWIRARASLGGARRYS